MTLSASPESARRAIARYLELRDQFEGMRPSAVCRTYSCQRCGGTAYVGWDDDGGWSMDLGCEGCATAEMKELEPLVTCRPCGGRLDTGECVECGEPAQSEQDAAAQRVGASEFAAEVRADR